MKEQLTMVGEWILGELVEEEEKTEGGIFVPKGIKNPQKFETRRAKILGIGDQVESKAFKVGDEVIIYYESGLKCEKFGHLFKEKSIMGVITKCQEE